MAIAPVPALPFPRRPFSSITPFTYSDAMTHLELLEKLRVYAGVTLPDEINKVLDEYSIEITEEVQAAIDLMIGTLNDKIIEINDALADQQADYTQKISDLTAYVDDAVQQIINNSIEVQDPVVAGLVNDTSTLTGAALDDAFIRKNSMVYNAEDHGVVGDGTADDTTTMQALIDMVPSGSTIVSPPGAVYRSAGWVVSGKDLELDFSNATLLKITDNPIVKAEGVWDVEQAVTSVTHYYGNSRVNVDDGSPFRAGDIVKIVSDETFQPSMTENRIGRPGQFAVVDSVDGNEVSVSPALYDEYTTNIRIFRAVPYNFKLEFANADWGPGGGTVEFNLPMFQCVSMVRPYIRGHVTRAPSTVFEARGCLEPTFDVSLDYAPGATGYGIADHSSNGGHYTIDPRRARHAFTDSGSGGTFNDDPSRYGRSMYARIYGASSGGVAAVYDTHSSGVGHSFYNIKVAGAPNGPGFTIRGIGHSYYNCEVHNSQRGFHVHDQEPEPGRVLPSTGHRLVNCRTYGVREPIIVVKGDLEPVSLYRTETLTIEGGVYEFGGGNLDFTNASIRFKDPTFIYTGTGRPGGFPMFLHFQQKAEIYGNLTLMTPNVEEGDFNAIVRFANHSGGAGQYTDLDVFLQPSGWLRNNLAAFVEFNNAVVGQVRGRVMGGMASVSPWANAVKSPHQQSAILRFERSAASSNGTSWFERTVSEGGNIVSHAGDDHVTIRLKAPTAVNAGRISPGVFPGQRLTLSMYVLAGGSVTIRDGSSNYNTRIGSDVTLAPGDALPLVWDGTLESWVRAG